MINHLTFILQQKYHKLFVQKQQQIILHAPKMNTILLSLLKKWLLNLTTKQSNIVQTQIVVTKIVPKTDRFIRMI